MRHYSILSRRIVVKTVFGSASGGGIRMRSNDRVATSPFILVRPVVLDGSQEDGSGFFGSSL